MGLDSRMAARGFLNRQRGYGLQRRQMSRGSGIAETLMPPCLAADSKPSLAIVIWGKF